MKAKWIKSFLIIFIIGLLPLLACRGKAPTREECAREMEKVQEWSNKNPDQSQALSKKFPEVDKFLHEGNYDQVRKPMIKMIRESLKIAGGKTACAEVLTDMAIENQKEREKTVNQGGEEKTETKTGGK